MDELLAAIANAYISAQCFAADDVDAIPDAKGAYLLLVGLEHPVDIRLQKRDPVRLWPGWLVYCGSAKGKGGLRARLRHHFARQKTPHWHVDRLTIAAAQIAAVPVCGGDECSLIASLLQNSAFETAARHFGNSDCTVCESHLLRFRGWPTDRRAVPTSSG